MKDENDDGLSNTSSTSSNDNDRFSLEITASQPKDDFVHSTIHKSYLKKEGKQLISKCFFWMIMSLIDIVMIGILIGSLVYNIYCYAVTLPEYNVPLYIRILIVIAHLGLIYGGITVGKTLICQFKVSVSSLMDNDEEIEKTKIDK